MQDIGPCIGAAIMALVMVSVMGSMYAIAPWFLGFLAIASLANVVTVIVGSRSSGHSWSLIGSNG
jgi:hypothetical protein